MYFRKSRIADRLAGDEHMARAVEAVAAQLILVIVLFRNRIAVCIGLKTHTESRIEDSHIRLAGHSRLTGLDAHEIRRVVERAEVEAFADDALDVIVDLDGLRVDGAAVQDAVADRIDLVDGFHDAVLRVKQRFEYELDGCLMCRHVFFDDEVFDAGDLVRQFGAGDADSLTEAFCLYGLVVHVDELILQGRAARVDHKYFH